MEVFLTMVTDPHTSVFEDFALMRVIPGMKVIAPADSVELRCCFEEVFKC